MNPNDTLSPTNLYRRRNAFDKLKQAALSASNQLGAMSSTLLVTAEWKPFHDRVNASEQILTEMLNDLRQSQIQYMRDLPLLSAESRLSLKALDAKLAVQEGAAYQWIQSNRRGYFPNSPEIDEWIYLDESIWITFQLHSTLDPVSAETTDLCLAWRFASLKYLSNTNTNLDKNHPPPHFQFGKWADDHNPVNRPEVTGLRSELLKAFLPHVPELAFVTTYVSSCTLTLGKGRNEWRASLVEAST